MLTRGGRSGAKECYGKPRNTQTQPKLCLFLVVHFEVGLLLLVQFFGCVLTTK